VNQYQTCDIPSEPLIRYTAPPTKYDVAPYGTLCALHLNDDGTDRRLYIQTAQEENDPHWIAVEELVIQAFKPLFENPCFLQDCLEKIKIL
jgi:hypothetical protein